MRQTTCVFTILTCLAINASGQTKNRNPGQDRIIDPVEISATFPGGVDSLMHFIKRNLTQPAEKKTGTVFVAFIVNKDGTTSNFEVVRGLTKEHDAIALEVLRKMPMWKPGT